ncbi:hypothetical protein M407DRAFT_4714 [Tulasnella calospora MUT 4182]|uniref:Uncharacterized protein n=1 Tax=Tulasnella calospora MUT 4182 TaxID=1051891 RepID=A0A0C3LDF9_9AGAM|nr:hypothetical protein M407DRAFT_4714 [Tulasnella calospora MUT 4182]
MRSLGSMEVAAHLAYAGAQDAHGEGTDWAADGEVFGEHRGDGEEHGTSCVRTCLHLKVWLIDWHIMNLEGRQWWVRRRVVVEWLRARTYRSETKSISYFQSFRKGMGQIDWGVGGVRERRGGGGGACERPFWRGRRRLSIKKSGRVVCASGECRSDGRLYSWMARDELEERERGVRVTFENAQERGRYESVVEGALQVSDQVSFSLYLLVIRCARGAAPAPTQPSFPLSRRVALAQLGTSRMVEIDWTVTARKCSMKSPLLRKGVL